MERVDEASPKRVKVARLRRRENDSSAELAWMSTEVNRRVTRGQILVVVAVTTALWLVFESSWVMLPIKVLATLIHEAGHAVAIELVGGRVQSLVVNEHGGGVTFGRLDDPTSTFDQVVVSSAGYLGTTVVGALLLEGTAQRSAENGRGVCAGYGLLPRRRGGPAPGDGLDWSAQGGHSDAAVAAEVTGLSSWMWAVIWLLIGVAACALALWSVLSSDDEPALPTPKV